jgi:hypothetical protein
MPADLGPGQHSTGHTLPRRLVLSQHVGGRAPPRRQAVGARRSTIAGSLPCPSDCVGEGDGRQGSLRHRHRRPASPLRSPTTCWEAAVGPSLAANACRRGHRAYTTEVGHARPTTSVPALLGCRGLVLCEVRVKQRWQRVVG